MNLTKRKSLKGTITFYMILLCFVPTLLLSIILITRCFLLHKEQIYQNSQYITFSLSSEIERSLKYYEHFLEQLANNLSIEISTKNALSYDSLKLAFVQMPGFTSLKVLDTDFRVRTCVPFQREELGIDYSGHDFVRCTSEKKVCWSEVYLSLTTGKILVSMATAFDFGVLLADLDIDVIQEMVREKIVQPYLHVIILDSHGNVIVHPDPKVARERLNLRNEPSVGKLLRREPLGQEFSLQGKEYIGTLKRLEFNGWVVKVGHLKTEALKNIKTSQLLAIGFIFLFTCLAALIGLRFVRQLILPINALQEMARAIKAGDFSIPKQASSFSELQEVYDAFCSMAQEIARREAELKRNEMKYRDLIENAVDPIFILDTKGNIKQANRAFLMKVPESQEVIGRHIFEFVSPEHGGLFNHGLEKALNNKPYQFELEWKGKSNKASFYSVSMRPLTDESGMVTAVQCVARDITQLKESEKRFRMLYESVSDFIYTQDLEGKILSCNPALSRLFGYEPEEFVGRKVSDFMKPEFREAFETEYLAKLKERKELEGVTTYFTKDGRKVYVEWKSTLVEPEVGQPFITGIARDITEKFLIQRSLKESESRLKAIFETVPVPVAVYDPNGCLIALNTAFTEVFGWTLEEARGQKLPPLPEEEMEEVRLKREETIRKGSMQRLRGHRFTKDGRLLDVEIYASALVAKDGKLELLVVAFHDVTERNRLEKALQHAEKMEALGTLAGGIAHNFNNILMGILGNAQLLKMRLGKEHPEAKRIDTILTLINDASNLTKQMLGLAKGGKYELRPTDLNVLIREHNRIFGQTRKDVEIREELSDGLWQVMCDRGQMKQVLMNLYVNAVQAIEAKSAQVAPGFERKVIAIKTENVFLKEGQLGEYQPDGGDFVKISISDNGIGMDEHIKKRIFEPFFTTKAMGRGTGLGLASVYGIVKNHGGYIEVESTLGQGSTFHIYLPRMSQFAEIKDKQEKEEYKLPRRTGTILLIDDEELVLQTAKELIEELGFKVIGVTDPLEALKVHEDYGDKLDLIIVDIIMPKMSGFELIKAIRAKDQNVKIIVSSGYGLESDRIGAEELNIAGIVQKPFSIHSISEAINAVI